MAISYPYTFSPSTNISSSQVNANFSSLSTGALDKTGDTMSGVLTLSAANKGALAITAGGIAFTAIPTPGVSAGGTGTLYFDNGVNHLMLSENAGAYASVATTTAATDYSATSTITGWTSFTTKKIYYTTIGKRIFVDFDIEGTSNAVTASFTVPTAAASSITINGAILAQDNGGTFVMSLSDIALSTSTVRLYPTANSASNTWTNSGTKVCAGQISYIIA